MEYKPKYKSFKKFLNLLEPDKREIKNVYLYAIFHGLISLSLPLGIQAIVNLIQGGQINSSWILLVAIVILGVLLSGIMQTMQLRITENLKQKIFTRAAFEFAFRLPRMKLSALKGKYAPELMNRFFDVVSLQKGLAKILLDLSTSLILIIFGLLLLSVYHPFFTIFSAILVMIVVVIFGFSYRRGLITSIQESKDKYAVVHWLEELARNLMTFKIAGEGRLFINKLDDTNNNYIQSREKHFKILLQQYYLLILFKVIIVGGLLAIGGVLVMNQLMNIGQFVAAEIIIILVINSVEKIIIGLDTIYDVMTSLEKVSEVTDIELEPLKGLDENTVLWSNGLNVEMLGLSFKYPSGDKLVLNNININLVEGQVSLIKGFTGSGKSTLFKLLCGLYLPTEGSILINGFPINQINFLNLRSTIGYTDEKEVLINGTIEENITLGRDWISTGDVSEIIDVVGLRNEIRSLNDGLKTMVGPQYDYLSDASAAKVLLARAVIGEPKLLLIDGLLDRFDKDAAEKLLKHLLNKETKPTIFIGTTASHLDGLADQLMTITEGKLQK